MPYLVQEFNYWRREHLVSVRKGGREYRMARYNCEDAGPRPESYYEDYEVRVMPSNYFLISIM